MYVFEQRTSDGRLRTGEAKALDAVLGVADLVPSMFSVLAAGDHGGARVIR